MRCESLTMASDSAFFFIQAKKASSCDTSTDSISKKFSCVLYRMQSKRISQLARIPVEQHVDGLIEA